MLIRFRHIITMLLLLIAIQAVGQLEVIDNVCVNATRHYRIDGEKNSTYEWKLYDNLSGATVTLTNPTGTPFAEAAPEKYGSDIQIVWDKPGEFRLEAIQYSELGCDTLRQGIIKVFDHPAVTPGVPALVCAGQPIPITGTTASNYSLIRWETSGDGTFDDANTLTPTYTPGPSDLAAGTATLTIHAEGLGDPTSCAEAVESLTITISNMQLAVTATNAKCFGSADGSATATLIGAYGTTTFDWTGPNGYTGNQSAITGLLAGLYSVTATDQNGCTATGSATVGEPVQLVANALATPATCFGSADGTAIVSASGGTGTYTYQWDDPANQTTQKATGLQAGIYTVTVTDANGCSASASVTITEPNLLAATVTSTAVSCYGGNDGSATVSVSGGTASYTYNWNDPAAQTSKTAVGLFSGSFVVNVTDANGCTASAVITVDQPALLTASVIGTDVKCFGGADGSAIVSVVGGTASYTYLWNDPLAQTSQTATGLKTGAYQVKVTDAHGCTATASVTISDPPLLTASVTSTSAKCYNGNDGTATVSVSGGTASYTYQWSDPLAQTGATAVGLAFGIYTVTVTDQNLCQATASVTISQPTQITIAETHIDAKCSGSKPGSIDVTVAGGAPGYTYAWAGTNGFTATTEDISGLAGTQSYTITVTDANGCTASSNIYIDEEKNLIISETHENLKCNSDASGSIDIKVVGGKKDFIYTWYNLKDLGTVIASTEDIASMMAGTYRITVEDANGCTDTREITLTEPEKLVATILGANVKCNAGKDGSATVSVSGGTASYTFSWNDPANQTTATATGLAVGTYTVTVTDANGCTTSASVTLTEPTQLIASASSSAVKCFGGKDGAVAVSVSGGVVPYSYLWNDPSAQTTPTASNLSAGTYRVDVSDINGCSISATATVTQPLAPLTVAVSTTEAKCNGSADGTASSTVSGGTLPYTYLWNDAAAQTTPVAVGLKAGTYLLAVTDANGCTGSATVTINEPNPLVVAVTGTDVKCFGGTDGTATALPTGGVSPYTYLWSDASAQTTATATSLVAGTYQVRVTDANGCNASATYTIGQPSAPLSVSVSGIDVKCNGANDGQASASVSGGTLPYTYLWNDAAAQTTSTAIGLVAGTFSVTVNDANGCAASSSVTIGQPTKLVASISGVNLKCFGATDGSATVSVSGGTVSYTYLWDDAAKQTTATATGLTAGVYGVTITDANGCSVTSSITLTQPAASVTASVTGINVKCFGGNDGSATVIASGGTATYTYLWDDLLAQKTATAVGLAAGDYHVLVTDANGCSSSASITITEPTLLTASVSGTDVTCFGGNNGTATVIASGGTATYTYLWDDPAKQTTATATSLSKGVYHVAVTDANGCAASATVTINEPSQLVVSVSGTDVKCFGGTDGTATVLASGGTVSYTYLWNDPAAQTSATATGLKAGTYQVVVTDANGCSASATITIKEPSNALLATVTSADVKCFGGADGSAKVSVSGGTPGYTYLWNDALGQTTPTAGNLKAGVYQVTVTDSNGCTTSVSVTINEPPLLTVSVAGTNVKCFGGNDGEATASVLGGTPNFTYQWNDPVNQTSSKASGLKAGTYQVIVTDANGCSATATITITEPLLLTASASGTNIKCFGGKDGTATVLVSGGTASYTYLWNDPSAQTTPTATGLRAGSYQVTVTDANGCKATASVILTEPAMALSASIISVNVKCYGGNDGSAAVSVSGGTSAYTYLWNDPASQTSDLAGGLTAGTYQVLITDANGCTLTASVTITQPPASLQATVAATAVRCFGGNDGSAVVSVSGGTPAYTYLWDDVLSQSTAKAVGLVAGTYHVLVEDANACTTSATVTVNQPAAPLALNISATPVKCFGGNDGSATAVVSGGTVAYSYLWDDSAHQTSATASNLKAGLYTIIVTDANGCTISASVTISEPPALTASVNGTDVKCYGGTDGSATVTGSGGTAPYTFSWNDPAHQITQTASNLSAGTYQATVTDLNGCVAAGNITILQPAQPLAAVTSAVAVKCFGGSDGSVSVVVSGGTTAYTYLWNDAAAHTTPSVSGLTAGVYKVVVTDANGCTVSSSVTVTQPPADLAVTATGIDVKCYGGNDGKANASVSGGTPAYTYLWSDASAQTTATATGLVAGNYKVVVADANGCSASATVTIKQPLSIPTSTTSATVCQNLLPYNWNGNNYSVGGTYSVTLTTKLGCDSIAVLKLQIEIPKVPTFAAIANLCKGSVAPALPNISTNGYTGTWSPAIISTAVAGTSTYTFTPDAGQCATPATLAVTVIEPLVPVFDPVGPLCLNTTAPSLPATSNNGIPGTWSPSLISTNTTGTFNYTFTPAAGQCATTAILTVEITAPQAFAGLPETICPGNPYTLAAATAQNHSSLLWTTSGNGSFDNPAIQNPTYSPGSNDIAAGIVTLTLTAQGVGTAPGCVPAVSSVTLNIIRLDADVKPSDVTCYGAADGTIIITAKGTGNYEFKVDGLPWQTNSQYKNLGPGDYTVEMRDASIPSCVRTLATITIVQPEPLIATVQTQDATCLGNDGIISIPSQDGGSGSYEYSLNGGPWTSTGYFTGLVPGSYHLDMRDLNVPTCTKDLGLWTVGMPVPIVAKVDKMDVSCASGNDGKIVISDAKNGSSAYEFNIGGDWSTQFTFENLVAGTYTIQMRDYNAKACIQSLGTITINEPAPLQATISFKNITCHGMKDGSISVQSPSGGSGTHEYTIDGITWGTTANFTNLSAGTYYVLMRDKAATSCVRSFLPVDIVEPLPLTATISKTDISCFGAHDGKIIVSSAANGTLPYQYQANGAGWQASSQFNGLGTNTYTIEISDANGCKETLGSLFVIEPKPLTATVDVDPPTCKGNDGKINISDPAHAASELVGIPGKYMYQIEKSDGSFSQVSDRFSGPADTYTFGGLATGTYTVKVYDFDHPYCIQTLTPTYTLSDPDPLLVAATKSDVTCFEANDGTVSVTTHSGGSGNYDYYLSGNLSKTGVSWDSGWVSADKLIGAIPPGQFTLQMRDANNTACLVKAAENYTISEPPILAGTATSTDERCWNAKDGTITIQSSTGGHGSYEYQLNGTLDDGTATSTVWIGSKLFKDLSPGTYTLQMRDALFHNCIQPVQPLFVIKAAAKLLATVTPVPVKCFGQANGEILIKDAKNGKEPYQYSISGGATWTSATTITGLKADTYTVTIMDGNLCSNTLDPVEVTQPDELIVTESHSVDQIAGIDSGTISVTIDGGTLPYKYRLDGGSSWFDANRSFTLNNLTPATYTITIKDENECQEIIVVNLNGLIKAKPVAYAVSCNGGSDGKIVFTNVSGGSGEWEYSIMNGVAGTWQDSDTFRRLTSGYYHPVVRDKNDKTIESTFGDLLVGQPDPLAASARTIQPEAYPGANNGIVEVYDMSGGSNNYVFRINGGTWTSSTSFTGLAQGSYIIDIGDPNSDLGYCFKSLSPIVVGVKGILTLNSIQVKNVRCYGEDGKIIVQASGVDNIMYQISGPSGVIQQLNNGTFTAEAGDYIVSIWDADNTANIQVWPKVVQITQPDELQVRLNLSTYFAPTCNSPNASVIIEASGGTPLYTGTGNFTYQSGELIVYNVTDNNGCTKSGNFGQMPNPPSIISDVSVDSSLCYGGTGTITFTAPINGKAPYTYTVRSSTFARTSQTKLVFNGVPTGATYTCTVTDANQCKYEETVAVGPQKLLTASVSVTSGSLCAGGVVTVNVTATGGTAPYKMGADRLPVSKTVNLESGTQTFTITDANGCTTSTTISPVAPPDLQVTAPVLACTDKFASIIVDKPGFDASKYQYKLNGGSWTTTTVFGGLKTNTTYTVQVQDIINNCTTSTSVETKGISVPEMPTVALTATPTCLNENGMLEVTSPVGAEYAYKISGNVYLTEGKTQTSTIFSNLKTDTYTITVTNTLAGCESVPTTKEVPAIPPSPVISVSGVNPKCNGDTYTITVSVLNNSILGKTNYFDGTYVFYSNVNEKFGNVTILNGTATITGVLTVSKTFKDIWFEVNGCTSTGTNTSVDIIVPSAIAITNVEVTEQPLKGTQKGEINLTVSGGEPTLTYLWTSDTFTGTTITTVGNLTNLWAGNYSVTIIDSNNCQIQRTYKVPSNLPPIAVDDNYKYNCSALHENILANDSDPDLPNDEIRINTTPVVSPKYAKTFKINADDGTFDYEVIPGFTGTDSFVYEIEDKFNQTATAIVTIIIAADFDGDGIADADDPDADGDGILNVDEALPGQDWRTADFDGDGHPNWLDIDSDNDGIVDNIEAQPTAGYIPPSGKDENHNGIDDAYDPAMGGVKLVPVNTDATLYMPDNLPDFLDTDSDNDHVPDYIEGHDLNADGKVDEGHLITGKDSDSDGLDDAWDTIPNGCNNLNATGSNAYIQDFDGDGIRDWRDDNDDDDEYPTRLEDLNGDGDYSNDVTGHVGHPEYLWYGRDCQLFIPDAFSPNDDNVHDYFQIYCIEQYPNAKMYIFDQQGNKLFEKDHYGNVDYWGSHEQAWWDGTTTNRIAAVNGRKVVPGTYYYVLKLGNGETKKSFVFVSY